MAYSEMMFPPCKKAFDIPAQFVNQGDLLFSNTNMLISDFVISCPIILKKYIVREHELKKQYVHG
jgi:hypothetical protein